MHLNLSCKILAVLAMIPTVAMAAEPRQLTTDGVWKLSPRYSPDGESVYYSQSSNPGRVFLHQLDLKTGEIAYKEKAGTSGTCYSSIAAAGDQLIMASEGGSVIFVNPGDTLDVTARNKIEKLRSTPVLDGKRLYLRTMNHLYCIAADK